MPSSARAALWMAGDRECPTGWPMTARRFISINDRAWLASRVTGHGRSFAPPSRAVRRRVAAGGFARRVVARYVCFEFGFRLGEGQFVAGARLGHVVQVAGFGGVGGG